MNDFNNILIIKSENNACNESSIIFDYGFKYLTFDSLTYLKCEYSIKNCILFLIKGNIALSTSILPCKRTFGEGELFLLPQASFIQLEIEANTQILLLGFNHLTDFCETTLLQSLCKISISKSDIYALKIQPSLTLFTETLIYCLDKKTMCQYWHKTMSQAFFLLLKEFYPGKDFTNFFAPIIDEDFEFKIFILQNYSKVNSINELIERSPLSRSMFYAKFKEVFCMTAKQWMLKQTANRLLEKASTPGMSVKELLEVCDFDSQSQLNRYIRKTFDCTPKELIRQKQKAFT